MTDHDTSTDEIDALIRESAAAYVNGEGTLKQIRLAQKTNSPFDAKAFAAMANLGWTGMLVPETAGGGGLGVRQGAALQAELGRGLAGAALIQQAHLPALAARRCTGPAAQGLLGAIASGSPCGFAFQPRAGALASDMTPVRLEGDGQTSQLSGEAHFVPLAGEKSTLLVAARGMDGIALIALSANAPGLRRTEVRTADGGQLFSLAFDKVSVGVDQIVGPPGEGGTAADAALDEARILIAAELLGLMRATQERTLDYLKTRKQFGRAIGSFQVLQHRAVDLYVQIELTAAALSHAASLAEETDDPVALAMAASSVKARASDAALLVTREAVQMHGAIGYTREHDIGLFLNRALTLAAALGTAAAHRRRYGLLISRQIAA